MSNAEMLGAERTKRYDIPLNHLDYSYINECTKAKELEKIVKILRTGEEGIFPDLIIHAEKKLAELNPKSRVLRKFEPVKTSASMEKTELNNLNEQLSNWQNEMKNMESAATCSVGRGEADGEDLPPIRSQTIISPEQNIAEQKTADAKKKKFTPRVKPRDYREWDKVDVDAELAKLDDNDVATKKNPDTSKKNKIVTAAPILEDIDTKNMTNKERRLRADKEKDKGNEGFRAGDYEEALVYYTRSLNMSSTIAATNNRAQCYIRMQRWKEAIDDCNIVLKIEPSNLKALLRRGVAYQGKKELTNAKNDLEQVLLAEPNNKRAKEILAEVEKSMPGKPGRRMVIEETDGSSSESDEYEDAQEHTAAGEHTKHSTKSELTKDIFTAEEEAPTKKNNKNTPKKTLVEDVTFVKAPDIQVKSEIQVKDCAQNGSATVVDDVTFVKGPDNHAKQTATLTNGNACESDDIGSVSVRSTSKKCTRTPTTTSDNAAEAKSNDSGSVTAPPPEPVAQLQLPSLVMRLKDQGNTMFKAGQYGEAIDIYTKAINKLQNNREGHALNLAILHSNRGACHLKVGDPASCVKDCDLALDLNPAAIKALLRRAQAREALEKYGHAYNDYRMALGVGGTNEIVHGGITRCQNMLQQIHGQRSWRDKLPPMPVIPAQFPSSLLASHTVPSTPPQPDPEQCFEEMKNKGNSHVKQGQFAEAVKCYSCCIECLPKQVVPYTNRALCFLRLNKPAEVITDCRAALALEPDNIKALFRRAQAYKMEKNYNASEQDLERVVLLDSKNTAARKELQLIHKYMADQKKCSIDDGKKRQRLKIEEVEESSDEESDSDNESESVKASKPCPSTKSCTAAAPPPCTQQAKKPCTSPVAHSASPCSAPPRPATATNSTIPSHCTAEKKPVRVNKNQLPGCGRTPYEFLQSWTNVKAAQGPAGYTQLLDSIEPEDLPKVLSNKLDGGMLATLIHTMHTLITDGQASRALAYLQHLTEVPRFEMVTMFMSNKEKEDLNLVLKELEEQAACDILLKDLNNLRQKFNIIS